MSAEVLRRAALEIREDYSAEEMLVSPPSPDPFMYAVADWLEGVADHWTRVDPDRPNFNNRHEQSAYMVARAYLGESA